MYLCKERMTIIWKTKGQLSNQQTLGKAASLGRQRRLLGNERTIFRAQQLSHVYQKAIYGSRSKALQKQRMRG